MICRICFMDAWRTSAFNEVLSSPNTLYTATKNGTTSQYNDPIAKSKKYIKSTPRPKLL